MVGAPHGGPHHQLTAPSDPPKECRSGTGRIDRGQARAVHDEAVPAERVHVIAIEIA